MKTLLQKAKEVEMIRGSKLAFTKDEIELAIAWAKGDVALKQVCVTLKMSQGSGKAFCFFASALRQAIRIGKLKETI